MQSGSGIAGRPMGKQETYDFGYMNNYVTHTKGQSTFTLRTPFRNQLRLCPRADLRANFRTFPKPFSESSSELYSLGWFGCALLPEFIKQFVGVRPSW